MCRWALVAGVMLAALISGSPIRAADAADALGYLEGLRGKASPFLAPSEIDPRFTSVLFVNVATSGPNKQRMWVLHRDSAGTPWRLGLWDQDYWKKMKLASGETPPFSWLISSGRVYRGDRKAGPTPTGIYGLDERKWRYGYGWLQSGMVHVMHIDYHYGDGRVTGVAFHGTPAGNYRRLGSNDSHGCIRMHQRNALAFIDRMTGKDGVLSEGVRWGEVPRFWQTEKGRARYGYVRNGKSLSAAHAEADAAPAPPAAPPSTSGSDASVAPGPADVLLKTGFRTLVVIFED